MVHAALRCKANLIKTFISQGDPRSQHSNSYLSTLFRTYVSQELPVDTIKKPSYFTGDFFTTIREVWGERNGELLYITTGSGRGSSWSGASPTCRISMALRF